MNEPGKERPGWEAWALGIAQAVAERGDCTRRRVGAVIIEPHRHRIVGAGYNGTEPGGLSCLKGECPRGRHYRLEKPYGRLCHRCAESGQVCTECTFFFKCACGKRWHSENGCEDSVLPGSSYDSGPGVCIASHAEQNALADAGSSERLKGAVMYVTELPCAGCVRQIRNTTDIVEIVWPDGRMDCRVPVARSRIE